MFQQLYCIIAGVFSSFLYVWFFWNQLTLANKGKLSFGQLKEIQIKTYKAHKCKATCICYNRYCDTEVFLVHVYKSVIRRILSNYLTPRSGQTLVNIPCMDIVQLSKSKNNTFMSSVLLVFIHLNRKTIQQINVCGFWFTLVYLTGLCRSEIDRKLPNINTLEKSNFGNGFYVEKFKSPMITMFINCNIAFP